MALPVLAAWVGDTIRGIKRQGKERVEKRVGRMVTCLNDAFFLRRRHRNPLALPAPQHPGAVVSSIRFDTVPFGVKDLRRNFGKDYKSFLAHFFDFRWRNEGYDKATGETKAYALRPDVLVTIESFWRDTSAGVPTDARTGQRLMVSQLPRNGVCRTSHSGIHVPPVIPFDLSTIDTTIAREKTALACGTVPLGAQARYTKALRHLYRVRQWVGHVGGVPNLYHDDPTAGAGRLYGSGDAHLQRLPRTAREFLYAGSGWWDYDFVRCHPTILNAMCRGLGIEFEVLDDYVTNHAERDNQLADELEVPVRRIKRLINAMLYGQTPANTPLNPLYALLGKEGLRRLQDQTYYLWLYDGLKRVRGQIVEHHTVGDRVVNAVGKQHPTTYQDEQRNTVRRHSNKKLLAHVLQGCERYLLEIACRDREDVLVLMHDGFICRNQRDTNALTQEIAMQTEQRLGYPIRMELKGVQK